MQSGDMDKRQEATRRVQLRYASLGLEFGAGIAGFVLVGYWIDSGYKTAPVGLITGAVLGCVGGLFSGFASDLNVITRIISGDTCKGLL